jgi:hypothetical protein
LLPAAAVNHRVQERLVVVAVPAVIVPEHKTSHLE